MKFQFVLKVGFDTDSDDSSWKKRFEIDKKYLSFVSLFALSVLIKLVLFTVKINDGFSFDVIYPNEPLLGFLMGYSIYFGVALLFVALGLFSKHFWPAFLLDLILDIWILANLLSMRIHGLMITGYDFRLIDNMDGFWDSVIAFITFTDILMFLSTGAFIYVYIKFIKPHKKRWIVAIPLLALSILLIFIKPLKFNSLWGMPTNFLTQLNITGEGRDWFAKHYSIFFNLLGEIHFYNTLDKIPRHMELSTEEKNEITAHMVKPAGKDSLKDNLLIIFVESMEGWTLMNQINGQEITPNINALCRRNAIYGSSMRAQVQRGSSSDAQLIVNTGLMPLVYEAVCFAYVNNYYYSIGDAMMRHGSHNMIMIPTEGTAWNQNKISKPWGMPTIHSKQYSDEELFNDLATAFDTIQEPFMIETVTMASHSPFVLYAGLSNLDIPSGLPIFKENYIKSLNYTDRCIGEFIEKVKNNPKFARTTIVILGDHCIFSDREEFDNSEIGRTLHANRGDFIPFIISSPNNIKESKEFAPEAFQFDIYPTLLSLFKMDNYPWRGLGRDLSKDPFDPNFDTNAANISERIIRNDFFRSSMEEYK